MPLLSKFSQGKDNTNYIVQLGGQCTSSTWPSCHLVYNVQQKAMSELRESECKACGFFLHHGFDSGWRKFLVFFLKKNLSLFLQISQILAQIHLFLSSIWANRHLILEPNIWIWSSNKLVLAMSRIGRVAKCHHHVSIVWDPLYELHYAS